MALFIRTKAIKALTQKELMRLARNFKILMGVRIWDKHAILRVLEFVCPRYDEDFELRIVDLSHCNGKVQGFYDCNTHTVYIDEAVYMGATKGDEVALFTVVHELAHWALIWLFKTEPAGFVEQPFLCPFGKEKRQSAERYADMFACLVLLPCGMWNAKRVRTVKRHLWNGKNRLLKRMAFEYYCKRRQRSAESFRMAKKSLNVYGNRHTGTTGTI